MQQDVQQLREEREELGLALKETQKILNTCAETWAHYGDTLERVQAWLETFRKRVTAEEARGDENSPEDLERCETLLTEANQQKALIEELSDACEVSKTKMAIDRFNLM